jgi:hypothetical protein
MVASVLLNVKFANYDDAVKRFVPLTAQADETVQELKARVLAAWLESAWRGAAGAGGRAGGGPRGATGGDSARSFPNAQISRRRRTRRGPKWRRRRCASSSCRGTIC